MNEQLVRSTRTPAESVSMALSMVSLSFGAVAASSSPVIESTVMPPSYGSVLTSNSAITFIFLRGAFQRPPETLPATAANPRIPPAAARITRAKGHPARAVARVRRRRDAAQSGRPLDPARGPHPAPARALAFRLAQWERWELRAAVEPGSRRAWT